MRVIPCGMAVAAVLLAACLASGEVLPEGGIGITEEPDSVDVTRIWAGCPDYEETHGDREFSQFDMTGFSEFIDLDVDLLIDDIFATDPNLNPVIRSEAERLLMALDEWEDNRFDWEFTDLAVLYQYGVLSYPEYEYDPEGENWHFVLFQGCSPDTVPISERNHIDVYLIPSGPGQWGQAPSDFLDPDEDYGEYEWNANSLQVSDYGGNKAASTDTLDWPVKSAHGVCHEFGHVCWNANKSTYGVQYAEYSGSHGDYTEIFACAAGYLAVWPFQGPQDDLRYMYSILHDMGDCRDPGNVPSNKRYKLWNMFAAYLGRRFHEIGEPIESSLLYRWATKPDHPRRDNGAGEDLLRSGGATGRRASVRGPVGSAPWGGRGRLQSQPAVL